MANPQKENGYTAIANDLLEAIIRSKANSTQKSIILLVCRYTYGFQRKSCHMSVTFISNACGVSKRTVTSEMQNLIEMKVIKVVSPSTYTLSREISLNKNYEQWGCIDIQQVKNTSTGEADFTSTGEADFTQERNNINKNLNKNIKKEYTCSFEQFWSAYPKKTAKSTALRAWEKLKPDMELVSKILEALEKQKNTSQWQKENGQFIPYPATWLNGKRWEDELEQCQKPIDYNWGTEGVDFL